MQYISSYKRLSSHQASEKEKKKSSVESVNFMKRIQHSVNNTFSKSSSKHKSEVWGENPFLGDTDKSVDCRTAANPAHNWAGLLE